MASLSVKVRSRRPVFMTSWSPHVMVQQGNAHVKMNPYWMHHNVAGGLGVLYTICFGAFSCVRIFARKFQGKKRQADMCINDFKMTEALLVPF